MLSIVPATVETLDPMTVTIAGADTPQPCRRVAPAAVRDRGGVIRGEGGLLWIGAYETPDKAAEVAERVAAVVEAQQAQQEALNETSEHTEARVGKIADEAHEAALAAASASGIIVLSDTEPLPTARPGGTPLSTGDLLYLVDLGETPARITGVRIWDGANWIPYAFAAEHLIAAGSIVGDLIAAETEIVSPLITGGIFNGGRFQTSPDPERGIKIDGPTNQLILYSPTGQVLFTLTPNGGVHADNGYTGSSYGIVGRGWLGGISGGGVYLHGDGPGYGYGGGSRLAVDSFGRLMFTAYPWSDTSPPPPAVTVRLDTLPSRVDALEATPKVQQGSSLMNISASTTPGELVGRITVTFPQAFTGSGIPRVTCTTRGSATTLDHCATHIESVDNTGFVVRAVLTGSVTTALNGVPIDWIAAK